MRRLAPALVVAPWQIRSIKGIKGYNPDLCAGAMHWLASVLAVVLCADKGPRGRNQAKQTKEREDMVIENVGGIRRKEDSSPASAPVDACSI